MPSFKKVTTLDISKPQTMIAAVRAVPECPTFLTDTYFPTNDLLDIFNTDSVLCDFKDGDQRIAPFVKTGHVLQTRDGYETYEIKPARIAPKRKLTIDDLKLRGFGEAIFSGSSEGERAAALMIQDFSEMKDAIRRTIETMAAQVMQTNKLVFRYNGESADTTLSFGADKATIYTPSKNWDDAASDIFGDLRSLVKMVRRKSCLAQDVIVGETAGTLLLKDATVQQMLDLRRYELGQFEPTRQNDGSVVLGLLNVDGVLLRIIQYSAEYEVRDESGTSTFKSFIDPESVIVTAPGAGRTRFAAVTQIEDSDGAHVTRAGKYVPKFMSDKATDERAFLLTSRPITMPNRLGCWASMNALGAPTA